MTAVLTALVLMFTPQQHMNYRWNVVRPYNTKLERMAMCESEKHWHVVTYIHGVPKYFGGLQFDMSTWRSVGGRGFPNRATVLEQKYRAVVLIKNWRRLGYKGPYTAWPQCGSV